MENKVIKRLGYSFLIIFMALFVSEWFIRFYNSRVKNICPVYFLTQFQPYYKTSSVPGLIYEMQPGIIMVEDAEEGIPVNSLGFRDKEYSLSKPENVFRIIGLGDSICYGLSIEFQDRFLKIIEKRLNEKFNNKGIDYEVINCAVCGYNLTQYYLNLKNKALRYNPDLAIFSLWVDDLDAAYVPAFIGNRNFIMNAHRYLIEHSYLWKFLFFKFFEERRYRPDFFERMKGEENLRSLNKIIDLAQNNNVRLLFILQSTLQSDYFNSAARDNYESIEAILKERGIPFIEMHPFYLRHEKNIEQLANAAGDSHPNKRGNEIIAEVIFDYLINTYPIYFNTVSLE
ncbi:MAG: SGNH/GDSL hydrolase family protein [Candidatus Omnitrophota bacterium]